MKSRPRCAASGAGCRHEPCVRLGGSAGDAVSVADNAGGRLVESIGEPAGLSTDGTANNQMKKPPDAARAAKWKYP